MRRFSFEELNTRVRSRILPPGWPSELGGRLKAKGQPPGQPLPSGRYLSHRFVGRVSKFFSKYSSGAAVCLPRVPFTALSRSRGTTATPPPQPCLAGGWKPGGSGGCYSHAKHAWKLRGRAQVPPAAELYFPQVSRRLFGEGMGCFGSLLLCCHPWSLPGGGDLPRRPVMETARRAKNYCSYPHGLTGTWTFPPKTPWKKAGGHGSGDRTAPPTPPSIPTPEWNLGWWKEAEAGGGWIPRPASGVRGPLPNGPLL